MRNHFVLLMVALVAAQTAGFAQNKNLIGKEVAIPRHLRDGDEYKMPIKDLIAYGEQLLRAAWTPQEGGGRPFTKGTGAELSDIFAPLTGLRSFNRISAPDANSCYGCHAQPFGIAGGSGDIVANVFVLGQRFDFATFDGGDTVATRGGRDEAGQAITQATVANSRATPGMFGAGYIEMIARQITADLRRQRDSLAPGGSVALQSKGITFGTLRRDSDGSWITTDVEGIGQLSLNTLGPTAPPTLTIRPWHQVGAVVSLREFSNNAFNHHHGMQSTERFGRGDPDGDGFSEELTRADITAASLMQAAMAVPGRVIPNDPDVENAILRGEAVFNSVGCAACHLPSIRLEQRGWIYSEPNPYNPINNLRIGDAPILTMDLSSPDLPQPRLPVNAFAGVVDVPLFTDFKLHDICTGDPSGENEEALDQHQPAGSVAFFSGNRKFLTKRLWDAANQPPFFHHGRYTTLRQAVMGHYGEATDSRLRFLASGPSDQDALIEYLKSMQVLPPGTKDVVVDENFKPKVWPPRR